MNKKVSVKIVVLIIIMSGIVVFGLFFYLKKRDVSYELTPYEVELLDYFKEIVLQSEYGDNPEKVTKWKEPMLIYVVKEQESEPQMSVIKRTIDEINKLATDGFKIKLTDNISTSNTILYLYEKERVKELAQEFYEILNDVDYDISGYSSSEFVIPAYVIDKAFIFISTEYEFDVQEPTILEEITQSLGLAFDSKKYANSIFYEDKDELELEIMEYSQMDRDIIRLLYHPKMKPGLDPAELDKVFKEIFKSEKKLDLVGNGGSVENRL